MKHTFIRSLGTIPQTPAPVQNLTAVAVSSTEIDLTWSAIAGAQNYTVRQNGNPIFTGLVTSYHNTGLSPSTQYTYTVAAINTFGEGLPSTPATATTQAALQPPAQVTGLTATATSPTEIDLAWTTAARAVSYIIQRNSVTIASTSALTYADTGLNQGTTYVYSVQATNSAGNGPVSSLASATTPAAEGGSSIVIVPGIIGRTGVGNFSGMGNAMPGVITAIKKAAAADINNQIKHFCVPAAWAQLESPAGDVYDGSWGTAGPTGTAQYLGTAGIQKLIDCVKGLNPPRGLMMSLNQTGNGISAPTTSTAFPSSFVPSYLNSATYDGGCEWAGRPGYSGYPGTNSTFYNTNTALRVAKMVKFFTDFFGLDTPTGGIYMWELTNEMSFPGTSMLTMTKLVNAVANGYSTIRSTANGARVMLVMRPTFVNPSTGYQPLATAMIAAKICMGNEDGTNIDPPTANSTKFYVDWGTQVYLGIRSSAGGPDHSVLNDWAFVWNYENAELGIDGVNVTPVPYASKGTGYLDDNATWPGIWNGVRKVKAIHTIAWLDGQQGPNINRFAFPTSSAPANPTPGPGAGLTSTRPHHIDYLTGNTAYPGITGPAYFNSVRPNGW